MVASSVLGLYAAKLPDMIEPALNPNHRKFFHSFTFGTGVSYAMYKVYKWEPNDSVEKVLRGILLILGGAYLSHLILDASTPKSLPLI